MLTRQPSIETLVARAGSRYAAVTLVARRAGQLASGALPLVETASRSSVSVALEELAAGRLKPAPGSEAAQARVRDDALARGDGLGPVTSTRPPEEERESGLRVRPSPALPTRRGEG
jgi:DNA-directed RNA polymerase omega subunit